MDTSPTGRRLQRKLEPDEALVLWTRGWVSRAGRLHFLLAARTLDFVVLTDRRLCLFSTGFFSRRPRRRVYSLRLRAGTVLAVPARRGRTLRLMAPRHETVLVELRATPHNMRLADAVLERAGGDPA